MPLVAHQRRLVHRSHRPDGRFQREPCAAGLVKLFLRGGLADAQGRPKGGRRHQNLTLAQERSLLQPLHEQARTGRLVTARSLKLRYETRVGRAVPDSTVYRLLARHQWRQVQPRPKHPKDNPSARAAFKKTPGQSGRPWRLDIRIGPCA